MQGIVTRDYEVIVSVELLSQNRRHRVESMVDTGFNGYLTLPADTVRQLNLTFAGHRRAMLGDGRVVVFDVYLANVWWFGQAREILVFQAEGGALLGMALLSGSRMTLDVVENGVVTIEQLENSAPV